MIIQTRDGKIYWMVRHAIDAMEEDNLFEHDIQKVLENAAPQVSDSSERDIYIYNRVAVVVDENDNIVTGYRIS